METKLINEQTIMIYFDNKINNQTYQQVQLTTQFIEDSHISEIIDIIPSYRAILIYFDNTNVSGTEVLENLELYKLKHSKDLKHSKNRVIQIPVCYGNNYGPDLSEVAKHNQLSEKEVIEIHTQQAYLIYMLGFMPGFPYLGGLDQRLHTPRRSEPRIKIDEGSVGIANNQTGLYPMESPGGWQIIGRTPLKVFDIESKPMTLYKAGDYIQFYEINNKEYIEISEATQRGEFKQDKWVKYENEY